MRSLFIAFILSLCVVPVFAQDDYERVAYPYKYFDKGSTQYLYGNNVVLRSEPRVEGKAVDTLTIGTSLIIMDHTEEQATINGFTTIWYKVKVGRKTGYVAGSLIAASHVLSEGKLYMAIYAGSHEEQKLRCRVLRQDGEFYGHEIDLPTSAFYITTKSAASLEGIENVVVVNLFAEACGVDGGEILLFDNGTKLYKAMHLTRVSDAGVFWFVEALKFPEDEGGMEDYFVYEREIGEYLDEELMWTRSTNNTVYIQWKGDHFEPDLESLNFDEE